MPDESEKISESSFFSKIKKRVLKMRKQLCLCGFWFFQFIVVVVDVVEAARTGRLRITEGDPRDLTLYKGPTNDYRPGKHLPTLKLIL